MYNLNHLSQGDAGYMGIGGLKGPRGPTGDPGDEGPAGRNGEHGKDVSGESVGEGVICLYNHCSFLNYY